MKKYFIVLITLMMLSFPVCAQETDNLKYEILSNDVSADELNLTVQTENLSVDAYRSTISSFTVTDNGYLVVGLDNKRILLFDSEDKLVTVFRFWDEGSYYLMNNKNNILIYLQRSDITYEITVDGLIIEKRRWDYSDIKTGEYLREKQKTKSVQFGNSVYRKEHQGISKIALDMGYCRLVKETDGEITEIYSSPIVGNLMGSIILFGIIVFFTMPGITLLYVKHWKKKTHNGSLS